MQRLAIGRQDGYPEASASTVDRGERQFGRGGRLVLALALTLLAAAVAQQVYRLGLPTLGWTVNTALGSDAPVFQENLLGLASPLRPGDVLALLNGRPLPGDVFISSDGPSWRETWRAFPLPYRFGDEVRVSVRRGGVLQGFSVPVGAWTAGAVWAAVGRSLGANPFTLLGLLIAAFVFGQRPRNTAARLLLLYYVSQLAILISRLVEPSAGLSLADLSSPLSYALAVLFSHLFYLVLLAPLVLHLCLSFPDTKGFIRRSPWLLILVYLLPWGALAVSSVLEPPLGGRFLFGFVGACSLFGSAVFVHTFLTAQDLLRRAQVRWVALGFGVVGLNGVAWSLGTLGVVRGPLLDAALAVPTAFVLTVCLALAVLRYRLFDIDLIINRTLVYSTLTALVVLLYIAVVGGVGALLGAQGNLWVSLVGTGLVAVLFQPLRERLQGLVNRLMYGRRDEPYALLTRLSLHIGAVGTPETMLPTLARTVAEALELPYAGLFLYTDADAETPEAVGEFGAVVLEPAVFALEHHGETFGELRLGPRSGGFDPKERALLATIARQASVAAYTVWQTRRLRRSYRQLAYARETERLRLRRDLHDGLGPTLAGLNLHLGALRRLEDSAAVRDGLAEVQHDLRRAAGEVRRLVHDLRPPSLDQLGFGGALEALVAGFCAGAGPTVSLELPRLPPLPPATETALYRVAQEALSNAAKHAQASCVRVAVTAGDRLRLTVSDDGVGLPETYRAGVGLYSMRERAEALGGEFRIIAGLRGGTTVQVDVPL